MAVAAVDDILRRVPPQNLEAEQSVLGAILLDNDAINAALEVLLPEDFYQERHRVIFRAMTDSPTATYPSTQLLSATPWRVRA